MAKRGGKCAFKDCDATPQKNPDLSFFRFPVKDKTRCIEWIINAGKEDLCELPDKSLSNRRLCSRHFKKSAYMNSENKRLMLNAVPMLWSDNQREDEELYVESPNLSIRSQGEVREVAEKRIQSSGLSLKTATVSEEDIFIDGIRPLSTEPSTPESPKYTPRKKKLLYKVSRQKQLLKKKTNSIFFLQRRQRNLNINELLSQISIHVSGEPFQFISMQIRHQQTKKSWNEDEKYIALSMYYKAPNLYEHLRKRGYKLPCVATIRKWIQINNLVPGFNDDIFEKLKLKAASMNENEKQCVLMCDEMTLKKSLDYNSKFDIIEGFEDFGPLGRSCKIASHAVVFMLRGLKHPPLMEQLS